jgi:hypothetical protein
MFGKIKTLKPGRIRNLKSRKVRNLKLVRSSPPRRIEQPDHHRLLVNDDGSLVADFDPGFVTLHTHDESIVMSWPEAVELALAIAMHARLPM